MTPIRRFLLRLLSVVRPHKAETDLDREIGAHLRLLEDSFISKGMSAEDARYAARRAFGGVEQAKEHHRDTRSFRWLDDSRIDFKLGARMLVKYPGVSLVGGAGLAVAIAICASFFAFSYAYLYSTLPIDEAERVIALENWDLETNNEERQQVHDFILWRDTMRTVEEISAYRIVNRNLMGAGGSGEPIQVAEVTPSAFRVTRVPPLMGRTLVDADAQIGAPPVAVIGHAEWQSRFAADPAILGRDIRLGTLAHTIVGVMPAGYAFPVNQAYWTPFRADPTGIEQRQGPEIFVFGRLVPGATMAMAQAELGTIGARTSAAFPDTHARIQPRVMPYTYPVLDIQDVVLWQMGLFQLMVSLLLVVVAANVAILIYARTATRRGEIAVRTALGASRRRIVGQLFIEALVLSTGAAAFGLLLARVGLAQAHAIMRAEGGSLPYWIDLGIPTAALVYVLGLVFVAAIIAGVVPALHATGRQVQSTLREIGGHSGGRLGKTWTTLVIAQVGIAVAGLPIAIGAFGWHQISQGSTKPAFEPEPYLAAYISIDREPPLGVEREAYLKDRDMRFAKLRTDLMAGLEAERDVVGVTAALAAPGNEPTAQIAIEDAATSNASVVQVGHVATGYFDLFDARILSGRAFTAADTGSASNPVIVNRAFVQRLLDGGQAVGHRFRYDEPEKSMAARSRGLDPDAWHEIVGVVSDFETNAIDPTLVPAMVFHPLVDEESRALFLVRARNGGGAFAGRLREIAIGLDPTARVMTVTLADLRQQSEIATRLVLLVLVLLIASVLLLSAAGIYALMSFTVTQRRKEIGIRAAMGANARQLLLGIFTRAAAQLAAGVVVGVAVVMMLDRASAGEVLGPGGRMALPAVSVLMIVVGLFAALGPARRGLRIQPTEALRED